MQHKSFMQVVQEVRDLHAKAQNNANWQSRDDRRKCYIEAEHRYLWLLELDPENAFVLGGLGSLYIEIGKWGLGAALLLSAARIDPTEPSYWNALGAGYRRMDKLEAARTALLKGLDLSHEPQDRLNVMHNLAGTYINEGEPQKAVEWATKALVIDPGNKNCLFNLGLAQLELGDYANGWDNYEKGGRMAVTWARNYSNPETPTRKARDVADWDGSPGKRVVVFGEQGVGDEILFAHAIPDLIKISKSVIIDCHPRLTNLFKRSFPEAEAVYGTRKDEVVTWPGDHDIECKVPFGSLHRFFRRRADDFPVFPEGYIKPDPAQVVQFAGKPGMGAKRVGISWIGGTRDTHVALRSMPLEHLAPILSTPGVEFVSLQYTEHAGAEVEMVRQKHGWNITHDDAMNKDLDKLFGCIAGLDLVITVLTSNVHFAGSMGVPAWVLTPIKSPWQFCQPTMPWYPNARLYRQEKAGDWSGVIGKMSRDLAYFAQAKQAAE